MNFRLLAALLVLGSAANGFSQAAATPAPAPEEGEKKSSMKDILKARMREEAKKAPPAPAPGAAPATANAANANTSANSSASSTSGSAAAVAKKEGDSTAKTAKTAETSKQTTEKTADQPATVLPKVEVQRSRITELDRQLAKQEQDIAREKKNMKQGEIDVALNDSKTSKTLSIFGGESSEHRAGIAAERVSLMEAEKDIIEAIAQTKDKAKKAELQKQLDELRTVRRELEKSRR